MRRTVVVGMLLLSVFLLMTGCTTGGGTAGSGGGFDTTYSIEQGKYVPVPAPQGEQGTAPAEGSEAK